MKGLWVSIAYLLPVVWSAKLDQTYLPPDSAFNSPRSYDNNVKILRYNSDNPGDGSYHFEYETENRISQHESGRLKNIGTDQEANVVTGSYSYTGPDGHVYTIEYIADENGFRASGLHIPTPPPVPEAILKSLQVNDGAKIRQGYNY